MNARAIALRLLALVFWLFISKLAAAETRTERVGDHLQLALPAIALTSTFALDDRVGRQQFLLSFAATVAITHGLKQLVDEKRPNGGRQSFPSGHTSAAFQAAAFIQRRYGWLPGLPAYLAASYVGYSRVKSEQHYAHDVYSGAAIGVACTYWTSERHVFRVEPNPRTRTLFLRWTFKN